MVPIFCEFKLVWPSYGLCKFTSSILLNEFLLLSFIMLYTEDFSMHHYVGFSQIGSQLHSINRRAKVRDFNKR